MDYMEKFKGVDGRRSIYDILSLTPYKDWEIIKTEYDATEISHIKIDGNTFNNYGQYQFIWEKTFVKSPKRSGSGNIGNLNSYATFLTPHLIINFSLMSIDDYRAIMKMHYERNEFTVECYDFIYNKKIKAKMYFATEEMAKLYTINKMRYDSWEEWIELVGVQEYKVELIGTNNELDLVSVKYIVNPPKYTTDDFVISTLVPDFAVDGGENDVYKGEEVVIGGQTNIPQETFGGRKKFSMWNTKADGSGQIYLNGYTYNINEDTVLYAQWEDTTEHTLTFNYGLADPFINEVEYTYETQRKVVKGKPIGLLPVPKAPTVKIKSGDIEKEYYPYHSPQWWKVPQKTVKLDSNGVDITKTLIVYDNEPYWKDMDGSIYLLYETYPYNLNLNILDIKTQTFVLYQTNSVTYNSPLNLPYLVSSEFEFDGWYTTPDFKEGTKAGGNMPPYNLTLYARWIAK